MASQEFMCFNNSNFFFLLMVCVSSFCEVESAGKSVKELVCEDLCFFVVG